MRCRLLAALALLGATSLAHADYVVIIANLAAKPEALPGRGTNTGSAIGVPQGGGPMGPPQGGMRPPQGGGGPMVPPQGGGGPMVPPQGGGPMVPPQGGGMRPPQGGFPGMQMGMPGGGMMGRPGMQMGMQMGMPGGGMMGRPGMQMGMQMGMPGGGMFIGGTRPGEGGAEAIDENRDLVVVVVELTKSVNSKQAREFNAGRAKLPLVVHHRWGRSALVHKNSNMEAVILETAAGKTLPSVHKQFLTRQAELLKNPTVEDALKLARWALENGLIDDFEKVMDKLAETEKGNAAVAAYLKVKSELARPIRKDDGAAKGKGKLLEGYKVAEVDGHHYVILHNGASAGTLKEQFARLEKGFKGFYYWWALRADGTRPMPKIPAQRQVAVLTDSGNDFRRLQKNLTASPVLTDSFVARREGLAVFASKRGDPVYATLDTTSRRYWSAGFNRAEVLKGTTTGIPREANEADKQDARIRALLLKAMEDEWEATGMSHEAARQLLFSAGLLPANVIVPEWLQFGMASFFETPLQSPFGGPGGASPYWLPRFKEYSDPKAKKYGKDNYETLLGVITDANFRAIPKEKPGETDDERLARVGALSRARAAAWALTYFLAQNNLDGLHRYYKELARMPRDVELDAEVLRTAFARAFDCVKTDRTPDRGKLKVLADRWIDFTRSQAIEAEAVHKAIRGFYAEMNRSGSTPGSGGTVAPGGRPGGVPPRGGDSGSGGSQ